MNKWAAYRALTHSLADPGVDLDAMEKEAGVSMMGMLPLALMGYGGYNLYGRAQGAIEQHRMAKLRKAQIEAQIEMMKRQKKLSRQRY